MFSELGNDKFISYLACACSGNTIGWFGDRADAVSPDGAQLLSPDCTSKKESRDRLYRTVATAQSPVFCQVPSLV